MATRAQDGPVLSWEGEGGRVYIEVDCIPSFTDSQSGKTTDFALETGASIADHFVRSPQLIKLEINQTTTPHENAAPQFEESVELTTIKLDLPPSNYRPTGILAATAALNTLLSRAQGPTTATVLKPKTETDRINKLYDELQLAYDQTAQFELVWLGRTWGPMILETFDYARSAGRKLGVFSLSFKKIQTTSTASAEALQVPSELTMSLPRTAGNQPGQTLTGTKRESARESAVKSNPELEERGL